MPRKKKSVIGPKFIIEHLSNYDSRSKVFCRDNALVAARSRVYLYVNRAFEQEVFPDEPIRGTFSVPHCKLGCINLDYLRSTLLSFIELHVDMSLYKSAYPIPLMRVKKCVAIGTQSFLLYDLDTAYRMLLGLGAENVEVYEQSSGLCFVVRYKGDAYAVVSVSASWGTMDTLPYKIVISSDDLNCEIDTSLAFDNIAVLRNNLEQMKTDARAIRRVWAVTLSRTATYQVLAIDEHTARDIALKQEDPTDYDLSEVSVKNCRALTEREIDKGEPVFSEGGKVDLSTEPYITQ